MTPDRSTWSWPRACSASCTITWLHGAAARFEARYPGQGELLRTSDAWTRSLHDLARRIEERFVDDLAQLVAPGGRVYLSESVQMCYVTLAADGGWTSPGTYRMLRTKDLADYVRGKFTVVERDRWEWVVNAPAKTGDVGTAVRRAGAGAGAAVAWRSRPCSRAYCDPGAASR